LRFAWLTLTLESTNPSVRQPRALCKRNRALPAVIHFWEGKNQAVSPLCHLLSRLAHTCIDRDLWQFVTETCNLLTTLMSQRRSAVSVVIFTSIAFALFLFYDSGKRNESINENPFRYKYTYILLLFRHICGMSLAQRMVKLTPKSPQ
jgi:hypothetical protein